MGRLQFGWSEVDITPKCKIALAGEFFERVTDEVETPIAVTALAIKSGDEQAIFVSCDLVGIGDALIESVKAKLTNKDIDQNKIIISAIHTHNSYTLPATLDSGADDSGAGLDVLKKYMPAGVKYNAQVESTDAMDPQDALAFVSDKIAQAIENAWNNLADGGYKAEFGRVAVGMNRRVCYTDGSAKMWGDCQKATFTELEGGNDNGMELLFIYDSKDKMTGIVANIACPSQVLEQRTIISSDYWGKVKALLRAKYGKDFNVLGLCSAAGDLCPRDLIRWVEPETPIKDPNVIRNNPKKRNADPSMFDIKGCELVARRIVNELELVMEMSADDEIIKDAEFVHKALTVRLPLRKVTDTERDNAERLIGEFFKGKTEIDYMDTADLHVYGGTLSRYEYQKKHDIVKACVNVVRLGKVAFASNPFELFLDYGNQMRARSDAEQTFIIQLANGSLAYLPTKKAEEGGHYSAYISSGRVGHEGGDILVRETLETIKELFN